MPLSVGAKQPTDVLDMPVDPNEPTYCFCHQVSYGEMIGCDNQDVSVHTKAMLVLSMCYVNIILYPPKKAPSLPPFDLRVVFLPC